MTTKAELRAEMRRVRGSIVDRPARSRELCRRVAALDQVIGARAVMAFVGVRSEPDTADLLARLRRLGIAVALPRVVGDGLVPVLVDADLPLVTGAFGIPEALGEPIDPAALDVVVVPGLAFTPSGQRLGQGGGHFDRFLADVVATSHRRTPPTVVGVCFHEQIVEHLPIEAHDRPVDIVVTDRATLRRPWR